MTYPLAVAIGILVGVTTGYAAERVPVRPLIQSLAAALVAMLIAPVLAAVVWLLRPPPDAEVLAISFGVSESLITTGGILLLAAGAHVVLGWLGGGVQWVVHHRGIIMGLLGALWGAVATTSGLGFARALK